MNQGRLTCTSRERARSWYHAQTYFVFNYHLLFWKPPESLFPQIIYSPLSFIPKKRKYELLNFTEFLVFAFLSCDDAFHHVINLYAFSHTNLPVTSPFHRLSSNLPLHFHHSVTSAWTPFPTLTGKSLLILQKPCFLWRCPSGR
jgi:hypothetical protein